VFLLLDFHNACLYIISSAGHSGNNNNINNNSVFIRRRRRRRYFTAAVACTRAAVDYFGAAILECARTTFVKHGARTCAWYALNPLSGIPVRSRITHAVCTYVVLLCVYIHAYAHRSFVSENRFPSAPTTIIIRSHGGVIFPISFVNFVPKHFWISCSLHGFVGKKLIPK